MKNSRRVFRCMIVSIDFECITKEHNKISFRLKNIQKFCGLLNEEINKVKNFNLNISHTLFVTIGFLACSMVGEYKKCVAWSTKRSFVRSDIWIGGINDARDSNMRLNAHLVCGDVLRP